MRDRLALLLVCMVLVLPLTVCGGQTPPPYSYRPHPALQITADSAFTPWLRILAHDLPIESALCLFGITRNDTAFIGFVRPVIVDSANANRIWYRACPLLPASVYGSLTYLGIWHHHPNGICIFSGIDTQTFMNDRHATIDLVGCKDGTITRGKHKQ